MAEGDDTSGNQRGELRLNARASVFVELPESDEAQAPIMLCRLLDFSANGAQIRIDHALPVGAILRLSAQLPAQYSPLTLVGEVRWVRQDQGSYLVGFSLYEADQSDILRWKQLVAAQL
ncbi:MAG: hypothetical protein CVV10_00280 [Gammaproteobacteria bacterium HGW-Gammaproteobacteria-14]|nr:MAG: hypothetical protein CVV10_00280 [Gammaproteobacteria bacterium HGW-Gammaproteobacteria-14]